MQNTQDIICDVNDAIQRLASKAVKSMILLIF